MHKSNSVKTSLIVARRPTCGLPHFTRHVPTQWHTDTHAWLAVGVLFIPATGTDSHKRWSPNAIVALVVQKRQKYSLLLDKKAKILHLISCNLHHGGTHSIKYGIIPTHYCLYIRIVSSYSLCIKFHRQIYVEIWYIAIVQDNFKT